MLVWAAPATRPADATTAGGTSITNTASATYVDQNNVTVSVVSNTITDTVEAVSSVVTGPNEQGCTPGTDAIVVGAPFVRTFSVTNASNVADSYAVTATASAGSIVSLGYIISGNVVSLANGGTLPALQPGGSLQVAVTANPGQTPIGSNVEISLTAKSTSQQSVNGQASSTASQCAIVSGAAAFSGPGGTGTQVTKLVDGASFASVAPGATVTYSIAFSNTGGVQANNVVLTDVVPANVTPVAGSVLLDGTTPPAGSVSLAGQTLTVRLLALLPGSPQTVTFAATVSATAPLGTSVVNTASLSADNAPTQATTPASLFVGSANVVYDGLGGQSQPVAGAVLTVVDTSNKQPVSIAGISLAPNSNNTNPFMTGSGGAYSFGLAPTQPTTYLLTIAAPGYVNRQLMLKLSPLGGGLYSVTVTPQDGEMLAQPGGFALASGPVTLSGVAGMFGNLPLFRTQSVTITKTVDRAFAATGDRLVYTITFANAGSALGATSVVDALPPGLFYAPGTGRVDNIPQEPVKSGRNLTWSLPALTTQHAITFATVIMPGTADYTVLTNVATVTAAATTDVALTVSASSSVDTRIVPGVFSDSTIVTGRVFYDVRRTGFFTHGDVGIANVRIFLEDGESVLTDPAGRYSFPAVKPGMHVLRLDKTSLPADAHPYPVTSYDDERSIRRLVHGVFDGGLIQDVNFALAGAPTK